MSQLLDIITGALDGIDLEGSIGSEADTLLSIADTVSQLTQGQSPELAAFVDSIAEMDLPEFNFSENLGSQINQVRELIPSDMVDILNPITEALASIDGSLGEGITDLIEPVVNGFRAIQTLLHTNFNFSQTGTEGEGGDELGATTGSIISSNPETQISPARLQSYHSMLDELPEEPTIANLLQWFDDKVTIGRGDMVQTALRSIPYLDDVRTPLHTVLSWQSMSGPDFQSQINNTVQILAQAITSQVRSDLTNRLQDLSTLAQQLDLTQLRQTVVDINAQLNSLKDHIEQGTLAEPILTQIENDMTVLIAARNALALQFSENIKQHLESQLQHFAALPHHLQEKMSALLLLLQPPAAFGAAHQGGGFPPPAAATAGLSGLDTFLEQYTEIFESLMSFLDISEVAEQFAVPGEAIEQAVNEIDEAVTMVTMAITSRLNQVQNLATALDVSAISLQVEQAIEDFAGNIINNLSAAFSEVRSAIEALAAQVSSVVASFNPEAVVATIDQGMDSLASVLQQPEITAILEVAEKLKSIADRLEELSFAPVTDTVVGTIDDMSSAVQGLGSNLDDPLKGMLVSAIDVLPDDLTPVTDPLIDGLGNLIEAGPIPLLEAIKDAPQHIVDAINDFDPAALIGDSLSTPFQELIGEIEDFEPDELLAPIATEVENFKERLRENVKPGVFLDPIIEIHDQILLDLEGFQPSTIVDPINSELTRAVEQITDAIPIEGVFDEIETVIEDLNRILGVDGVADSILQLVGRIRDFLAPFVDATEEISIQIRSWLDEILRSAVDSLEVSALQTAFTDLASAIDDTQATALQSLYDETVSPISTAVRDILQPRALMTELVRSHSQLRSAWNGMAESSSKSRVDSILLSVDPTSPDFTEIFTAYSDIVSRIDSTGQNMESTLADWDQLFHQVDGVLASYRQAPTSPQELKQWLMESLENQLIHPLQTIFEKFAAAGRMLDAFIGPIVELVEELRTTANQIIAAPAALLAVGESLEQVRERLQNINLDFISESIDAIYNQVKEQVRTIDPRSLKRTLDTSFDDLVSTIDLDQIVPVEALNQTDDDIDLALEALRQLDPQVLIGEVLQPKFEEILAPFVSALDLSPALNALTERLRPLESELGAEMDRVNEAYQGFLSAVPA